MRWPSRLVIASQNRAKAGQMIKILSKANSRVEILTLSDFGIVQEPEESGLTYRDNAEIKAKYACETLDEWCLADDAGIEIDYFNGNPGVYSKRFLGAELPFAEKNFAILKAMEGLERKYRGARFQCAVCLAIPKEVPVHFFARCDGEIALEAKGSNGFGYDPIFFVPEFQTTMADLEDEKKFLISHRGKVLHQLIEFLQA